MKHILILLILFIVGCDVDYAPTSVDPFLEPYLIQAESDLELNLSTRKVSYLLEDFSDTQVLGRCYTKERFKEPNKIVISKTVYINRNSETFSLLTMKGHNGLLAVLAHEIFHCVYGKDHIKGHLLMGPTTNYNQYSGAEGLELLKNHVEDLKQDLR